MIAPWRELGAVLAAIRARESHGQTLPCTRVLREQAPELGVVRHMKVPIHEDSEHDNHGSSGDVRWGKRGRCAAAWFSSPLGLGACHRAQQRSLNPAATTTSSRPRRRRHTSHESARGSAARRPAKLLPRGSDLRLNARPRPPSGGSLCFVPGRGGSSIRSVESVRAMLAFRLPRLPPSSLNRASSIR